MDEKISAHLLFIIIHLRRSFFLGKIDDLAWYYA